MVGGQKHVWELRIHGVNNTPPESMLRTRGDARPAPGAQHLIERVAGDDTTGFYRYAEPAPGDPRVVVEAFSWGQLTSGRRLAGDGVLADVRRAAWSLVLPFALVNLALWARPHVTAHPGDAVSEHPDPRRGTDRRAWWLAGLVRLVAVSLTMTLTAAAAGAGLDLFAWQCEGDCDLTPWGLGRAADLDTPHLVAVAAVVPLALILGLAWVAGRTFQYEAVAPARGPRAREDAEVLAHPFEHPDFWSGGSQVKVLRRLHLAAALAVVAHVLAASVWSSPAAGDWWVAGAVVSGLALLLVGAVGLDLLRHGRLAKRTQVTPGRRPDGAARIPWLAAALTLAGAVVAWHGPGPSAEVLRLPGYEATVRGIFLAQFVLVAACLVVNIGAARRTRRPAGTDDDLFSDAQDPPAWRGLGTTVFAGGGWALGLLYSAAVLFGVAWLLNAGGGGTHVAFVTPTLRWAAAALVVGLVVAALLGCFAWRSYRRQLRAGVTAALHDEGLTHETGSEHQKVAAGVAGRWRALHQIDGYHALTWVGRVAGAGFALLTLGFVIAVLNIAEAFHSSPWLHWAYSPGDDDPFSRIWLDPDLTRLSDAGALLAVGLLLGLVVLLGAAYRSATVRRIVGIAWDVTTFWPRGAHPLAPPCYAEAAVPMLVTRISAKADDGPVILAGHSQGAVIAVACVFQLDPGYRRNVHLFTFGSQLSRLYARAFPAFFGDRLPDRLVRHLDNSVGPVKFFTRRYRWVNFFRPTDPLGWPMGGDRDGELRPSPVDVVVRDPEGLEPWGGEVVDPPVRHHTCYPLSAEYVAERGTVIDEFG